MRYTVHAELSQTPIEYEFATAISAISKAWELMGRGAKKVYIFDDELDAVYWPRDFCELHRVRLSELVLREMRERPWFHNPHRHSK